MNTLTTLHQEYSILQLYLILGCVGSEKLKTLHAKFTSLMQSRNILLTSFAEVETTNLPLRFRATLVPQESSGQKVFLCDMSAVL